MIRRRSRNLTSEIPRLISPIARITGKVNVKHKHLAKFLQLDSKEFENSVYGTKFWTLKPNLSTYVSHNTSTEPHKLI